MGSNGTEIRKMTTQTPTEAYPIAWPAGRPRTRIEARDRSRFRTTFGGACHSLMSELSRLGARNVVLSTNVPLRNDGMPYASAKPPEDTGVAVYFTYKKNQMCFACDRWDRVQDNIQAIRHTIAALRGVARWGTGDMMEAAFQGFTALPAPGEQKTWRGVLGFPNGVPTKAQVEGAYRRLRSQHHPDKGGDATLFHDVQLAYDQAIKAAT